MVYAQSAGWGKTEEADFVPDAPPLTCLNGWRRQFRVARTPVCSSVAGGILRPSGKGPFLLRAQGAEPKAAADSSLACGRQGSFGLAPA